MTGKIYHLYSYSLSHLTKTNRVKAVYLLKGRKGEDGIILSLKGAFIGKGCFMIPEKNNDEIKSVMDKWNIRYQSKKIMLMN